MPMPTDASALPESWQKPAPPVPVKKVELPECDPNDPAQLAAWYGPFGWADHLRKVVQANCGEVIRAHYALDGEKISEARLDALARVHPAYVEWLVKNLAGRIAYENDVLKRGIGS